MTSLLVCGARGVLMRPNAVGAMFPAFPVHPNDIAAVEVYTTRGETPAQYRGPRARCGTVLIWSRWRNSPAL